MPYVPSLPRLIENIVGFFRPRRGKPGNYSVSIGHTYSHHSELAFYQALQANGIVHVDDSRNLMKSRVPCYTSNPDKILVPHIKQNGTVEVREWFPDAVIRLPGGNIHFVEVKSFHPGTNVWKYNNFRDYFSRGGKEFAFNATQSKSDEARRYFASLEQFKRTYGDLKKIRYHKIDRIGKSIPVITYKRVPGRLDRLAKRYGIRLK